MARRLTASTARHVAEEEHDDAVTPDGSTRYGIGAVDNPLHEMPDGEGGDFRSPPLFLSLHLPTHLSARGTRQRTATQTQAYSKCDEDDKRTNLPWLKNFGEVMFVNFLFPNSFPTHCGKFTVEREDQRIIT